MGRWYRKLACGCSGSSNPRTSDQAGLQEQGEDKNQVQTTRNLVYSTKAGETKHRLCSCECGKMIWFGLGWVNGDLVLKQ
jgi:hypothetical protein